MSKYEELDRLIINSLKNTHIFFLPYSGKHWKEACRIASETGREDFRVIDGRLQALRKAGKIVYLKKADAPSGREGWHLAEKLDGQA